MTGRARWLDLGRATVDGVPHDSAVACGIGFDATVMQATGNRQKLRWGMLAYLANAIGKSGGIRNVACDITLDGVQTTTQAAQVFIANVGGMPAPFELRRPIRPNDGLLDVIVVRASGGPQGLLAACEALRQTDLGESSGGHVFRALAREVRVETRARLLVEADGDVIGGTPVLARVLPRAVRVIAPRT